VLREVETDIAAVIEGTEDTVLPTAFRAKSTGGDAIGAKIGGGAAWVKN
jgi:hypothetical protein